MKGIISKVRSAMKAGLLPYWDVDVDDIEDTDGDIGAFMNIEATFKVHLRRINQVTTSLTISNQTYLFPFFYTSFFSFFLALKGLRDCS